MLLFGLSLRRCFLWYRLFANFTTSLTRFISLAKFSIFFLRRLFHCNIYIGSPLSRSASILLRATLFIKNLDIQNHVSLVLKHCKIACVHIVSLCVRTLSSHSKSICHRHQREFLLGIRRRHLLELPILGADSDFFNLRGIC